MAGILVDDLDRIVCVGGLISQVWAGPALVYQYDSAVPVLTVDIAGTSSESPTYVQSDSALDYTVTGTVSDADSGVKSVTVNGVAAEIAEDGSWSATLVGLATNTVHQITVVAEDNAGNVNTVNRYLCIEAYYQQAARVAGATVQSSLDATLKNSTVCTTIAGNSTAYGIMKSKYNSDMTSYVASNFNDGLNYLNYVCGLKCYLVKGSNACSNITGGYNRYSNYQWSLDFNFQSDGMHIDFRPYGAVATKNKVNMSRFKTVTMKGSGFSTGNGSLRIQSVAGYDSAGTNLKTANISSATSSSVNVSDVTQNAYVCINDWGSNATYIVSEMYMTP